MHKLDNQLDDFFGVNTEHTDPGHRESIHDTLTRKLSLRARLRLLPKVLSLRERYTVVSLALIAILAILATPISAYYHFTEAIPSDGGTLTEGIVGEPRLVNPLLAPTNDADRDLAALVYSGLYHYNGSGTLVPDLAKSLPEVTSDGLSYSVTIRDDAVWQDGVPITADDVIFTIQTAQNDDYGAPLVVRAAWSGITVERASDKVVIFHLKAKYAQFPTNLTLGLLPKHLWQDVKPINFQLSELNLKPIGSGPYQFKSLIKDAQGTIVTYKLAAFQKYVGGRPHIDEIDFKFFNTSDDLIGAFNNNEVQDVAGIAGADVGKLKFSSRVNLEKIKMPRYFALFFNQTQSKALSDKNVRLALGEGTDRVSIINQAVGGNAFLVDSPMMSGVLDVDPPTKQGYTYDPDQAAAVLKASGWTAGDDGTLAHGKDNTLDITITTSTFPELAQVAHIIADQWSTLGAKVTVQTLPVSQLQQVIKDRSYQVLLFGEIMTPDPDPFAIWHSSQRNYPGGNLALYSNGTADKILETARTTLNPLDRRSQYNDFQNILLADIPAVFLYSPDYIYGLSRDVHGFDVSLIALPSNRFDTIASWYLDTKRQFK